MHTAFFVAPSKVGKQCSSQLKSTAAMLVVDVEEIEMVVEVELSKRMSSG